MFVEGDWGCDLGPWFRPVDPVHSEEVSAQVRPADESKSHDQSSTGWLLKAALTAENRRVLESVTAMSSGLFGTRGR